jgi:hypothetical protein
MDLVVVQLNMAIQVVVDLVVLLVTSLMVTGMKHLLTLVVDRVLDQVVVVEVL